jgi:hypothetical protein
MPNGVFQMGNGFFLGRTDAGEWKAFYYPLHNVSPRAMYAIGDKLLIESTGFISTLECVEARSGRSLWTYFFRRSYNESGPYATSVPGRAYDEAFQPAQWQARGALGVNVAPSLSDIEPYAGKVVFDPVAATANAASARTVQIGVTSWLIVGCIVVLSWRSHRARATILCLAVEGVLLLTFGYIDTRLLIAFAGAMLGTAAAAWVVSGRRGHRWIKIIVFVTVVLWYLPSVLRSVVRT